MDDNGRRGGSPGRTLLADRVPARRKAAVTGRLDDWWDPAWDDAWWDPVWDVDAPGDATARVVAASKPDDAGAPAAAPAEAGTRASEPRAAVAAPRTAPKDGAEPSWGQVLATTVALWLSRRLPRAGTRWRRPGAGSTRFFRKPRRPVASGATGPRWPARLAAASMLGAGLLAVGAGSAGLLVAGGSPAAPVRLAARPSPVPVPSSSRTAAPAWLATAQRTARPVTLTIPAIGVRTRLVDLGLGRNGTLQVPYSTALAGWFTGSPRPGAVGSAVIAGHVDSRTGPAVFYWLRDMRPGERIYVGRADGTLAVFTVTGVRTYPKDKFPTASVYGPVPDAELRLITCGGIFDQSLGSYLSNVVVFARLTG